MPTKKKVSYGKDRIKFTSDEKAYLIGIKCGGCKEIVFPTPVSRLCPACGSKETLEIELATKGTIWSYTIVHVGYGSLFLTPPYAIAFVKLEGGGYIHTAIINCENEEVNIGMDVELVLVKISENDEETQYTYAFQPYKESKL